MSAHLNAHGVSARYDGPLIVDRVDLDLPPGEVLAVIGPNGSGKSTFLRSLARIHALAGGTVRLDGQDLLNQPTRQIARRLAFLPQHPSAPPGLSLRDLVGLGRHPHRDWFGGDPEGRAAVAAALAAVGLADLADRPAETLSGGQHQRAWIALALAQGAGCLLLDEPTNHLDPAHQIDVLMLLRRLARDDGRAVAVVLHDLALAGRCCDRVAVLAAGRLAGLGRPEDVLRPHLLAEVYGIPFHVVADPASGRPVCLPCLPIDDKASALPSTRVPPPESP